MGNKINAQIIKDSSMYAIAGTVQDKGKWIMIKNKLNFFMGIFCLACFIINIVNHRDLFVICLTGIFAFVNIVIGVTGW